MPSSPVDLHTHSNVSDGTCTPTELIELAAAKGLAGLALTDHDTLDGLAEAKLASRERGIRFLAGVELSTHWHSAPDVHLLGYSVDGPANAPLVDACFRFQSARRERAALIITQLNANGVDLTLAAVKAVAAQGAIGRPHVARALVAGGWVGNIREAFNKWLAPGKPGYVRHDNIEVGAAVQLLRESGAVPVLAHPQTLQLQPQMLEELVKELVGHGLLGIEAYWSRQDATVVAQCEALATRYGLLATGGSDFHGENKPNRLGEAALNHRLDLELMEALEQIAAGRNVKH